MLYVPRSCEKHHSQISSLAFGLSLVKPCHNDTFIKINPLKLLFMLPSLFPSNPMTPPHYD